MCFALAELVLGQSVGVCGSFWAAFCRFGGTDMSGAGMSARCDALAHVLAVVTYCPDTGALHSSDSAVRIWKAYPYLNVHFGGFQWRSHRVAAMLMGVELGERDDVHHVNFVESDNRWSNLQVMTRSEHKKLHRRLQDWADSIQVSRCCAPRQRRWCSMCVAAARRREWSRIYRNKYGAGRRWSA